MTAASPAKLALSPTSLQPGWHQHSWENETLFDSTASFFQSLLEGIDQARESVILATYIFKHDDLGRRLIEQLGRARQRGLRVRVLMDGVGSMYSAETIVAAFAERDIEAKIYHPLPWQPENYRHALRRDTWLGSFITCLLKINKRHHGKLCIVDQQQLWCGSQNISADHLGIEDGGRNWHDYGVRVAGAAVTNVADSFDDFWYYRKPRLGRGVFKHYWNTVSTLARRRKNAMLTRQIRGAQTVIWIINPYFSPTRSLLRALRLASRRGVDVRIIVPNKSDIGFFPLLTATYYDELIRAGVRVFEYLPSILHAKLLLVDDFRLIGSTNLNHRSLLHDIEFDIVLESDAVKNQTRVCFLRDQEQCREILRKDLTLFGWRRLLGWVPWLLRYWL